MQSTYFDADAVAVACGFAETLTITKSTRSRRPERLELLPHSRKMIANTFGWRRPDGTRVVRKVFASFGRKQAKTQTAAVMALIEFFLNPEPMQEIYMAATDAPQATICFNAIWEMIRQSPDLLALVTPTISQKLIVHNVTGSIIRALSAEGKGKHGYNPSMVIFDELHAWGPAEQELLAALTTGSMSRVEPLEVIITTAGSNQETICYREYEYAKRVLAGEVSDESYLPLIYEVPKEADWTDQRLWPLALPLLETGHQKLEDYDRKFQEAMARPDKQNEFRRLYLNQWTSSETQWIPIHEWDACRGDEYPDLRRVPCYGGLDLGAVRDLTAFALCFPLGDKVYYKVWTYLPEDGLRERSKRDGVPYDLWATDGHIRLTPGNTTDWRHVVAHIKSLADEYDIRNIAYDRAGARDTARELQDAGIEVTDFGQGYMSMSPACKRFEKLIYDRAAVHDGNPLLRWNMDCCQITSDPAGNIKPVKPERMKNSKRIDAVVAMTMATGIAILTEPAPTTFFTFQ